MTKFDLVIASYVFVKTNQLNKKAKACKKYSRMGSGYI